MAPLAPIPPVSPLDQIAQAQPLTAGMLQATGQASAQVQANPLASFQDFFAQAAGSANVAAAQAEQKEKDMVIGGGGMDNLHDGFIAMEKADLSFQLTMAIRDKVISAYQTVMQMSV